MPDNFHPLMLIHSQHSPHCECARRPTGIAGLKRTHLPVFNTGRGLQPKPIDYGNNLIVNAQGEPTDTVRLKRTHFGERYVAPEIHSNSNRLRQLVHGKAAKRLRRTVRLKRTHFEKSVSGQGFQSKSMHYNSDSGCKCTSEPVQTSS